MQYLLLIYEDETLAKRMDGNARRTMSDDYVQYTNQLREAGVLRAGEALHPVSSASTVRVRSGRATTTDGPFAETKEQLGGFYMIEVANLDDALKWAAKLPGAATGSVEVRPIVKFG
jgi:hypothetical protein